MSPAARAFRRSPAVLWRSLGSDAIVHSESLGEPTLLGASAGVVWHLLDQPMTVEALAARFDAPSSEERTRINDELEALLDQLQKLELVERAIHPARSPVS